MLKQSNLTNISVNVATEGKFLYAYILITTAVQPQLNLNYSFRHTYDSIAMDKPQSIEFIIHTATITFEQKSKNETLLLGIADEKLPEIRLYITDNKLKDKDIIKYLRLILLTKLYHVLVISKQLKPITELAPVTLDNSYNKH